MPGLGRKVFTASEVLTAANVNGYLMDQTVMKYANTSAVSSAVGTALADGMQFFLTDTDETVWHNGTSFQKEATTTNAIINGAFDIWQRGTSFSSSGYTADRWNLSTGNTTSPSVTRQSFTVGSAPISGYESQYYADIAGTLANASTGYLNWEQKIEDVRSFAGQTITLSFWTKGSTAGTANTNIIQNFGSGGSSQVFVQNTSFSVTTSWTRISQTIAIPAIDGKTVGTSSYLDINFVKNMGSSYPEYGASNYTGTLSIWGVQVEAGSVATPFRRNAPSLQGELAACQRYYVRFSGSSNFNNIGLASALNSTTGGANFQLPVPMRVAPTSLDSGGTLYTSQYIGVSQTITAISYRSDSSPYQGVANFSVSSGLNTSYRYDVVTANTGSGNYVGFSAEL